MISDLFVKKHAYENTPCNGLIELPWLFKLQQVDMQWIVNANQGWF